MSFTKRINEKMTNVSTFQGKEANIVYFVLGDKKCMLHLVQK